MVVFPTRMFQPGVSADAAVQVGFPLGALQSGDTYLTFCIQNVTSVHKLRGTMTYLVAVCFSLLFCTFLVIICTFVYHLLLILGFLLITDLVGGTRCWVLKSSDDFTDVIGRYIPISDERMIIYQLISK